MGEGQPPVKGNAPAERKLEKPAANSSGAAEAVDGKDLQRQATVNTLAAKRALEKGTLTDEQVHQEAANLAAKLDQKSIKSELDGIKNHADRDRILEELAAALLKEQRSGKDITAKLNRLKDPTFNPKGRVSETSEILGGKPVLLDPNTGKEVVADRTKSDYDRICQYMQALGKAGAAPGDGKTAGGKQATPVEATTPSPTPTPTPVEATTKTPASTPTPVEATTKTSASTPTPADTTASAADAPPAASTNGGEQNAATNYTYYDAQGNLTSDVKKSDPSKPVFKSVENHKNGLTESRDTYAYQNQEAAQKGKPTAHEKVTYKQVPDKHQVVSQKETYSQAGGSEQPVSSTQIISDTQTRETTIKTKGSGVEQTVVLDGNGQASALAQVFNGSTAEYSFKNGEVEGVKVNGQPQTGTALDNLKKIGNKAIADTKQMVASDPTLSVHRETAMLSDTIPTKPGQGNKPNGTFSYQGDSGFHQYKVTDGVIKGDLGKSIGTIDDQGNISLNGQKFKISDEEGEKRSGAFHGTGSDGSRLDLVSKSGEKGFNGILSSPDGKHHYKVVGGNAFDENNKLVAHIDSNGKVSYDANLQKSRADINASFNHWSFRGTESGKSRVLVNSTDQSNGYMWIPDKNGKPLKYDVRMGMIINHDTGDQYGILAAPRINTSTGKMEGGAVVSTDPATAGREIPLSDPMFKNAVFDLKVMGHVGIEGRSLKGVCLGSTETTPDGKSRPESGGFLDLQQVVDKEQSKLKEAQQKVADQQGLVSSITGLFGTTNQVLTDAVGDAVRGAQMTQDISNMLSTGEVDPAKVARLLGETNERDKLEQNRIKVQQELAEKEKKEHGEGQTEQKTPTASVKLLEINGKTCGEVSGDLRVGDDVYKLEQGKLMRVRPNGGTEPVGRLGDDYSLVFNDGRTVSLRDESSVLMQFYIGDSNVHRVVGLGQTRYGNDGKLIAGGLVNVEGLNREAANILKNVNEGNRKYFENWGNTNAVANWVLGDPESQMVRAADAVSNSRMAMNRDLSRLFKDGFDPRTVGQSQMSGGIECVQRALEACHVSADSAGVYRSSTEGAAKMVREGVSMGVTTVVLAAATAATEGAAAPAFANQVSKLAALATIAGTTNAGMDAYMNHEVGESVGTTVRHAAGGFLKGAGLAVPISPIGDITELAGMGNVVKAGLQYTAQGALVQAGSDYSEHGDIAHALSTALSPANLLSAPVIGLTAHAAGAALEKLPFFTKAAKEYEEVAARYAGRELAPAAQRELQQALARKQVADLVAHNVSAGGNAFTFGGMGALQPAWEQERIRVAKLKGIPPEQVNWRDMNFDNVADSVVQQGVLAMPVVVGTSPLTHAAGEWAKGRQMEKAMPSFEPVRAGTPGTGSSPVESLPPVKAVQLEAPAIVQAPGGLSAGRKGDYLVVGPNGEQQIWPQNVFEKQYRPTEPPRPAESPSQSKQGPIPPAAVPETSQTKATSTGSHSDHALQRERSPELVPHQEPPHSAPSYLRAQGKEASQPEARAREAELARVGDEKARAQNPQAPAAAGSPPGGQGIEVPQGGSPGCSDTPSSAPPVVVPEDSEQTRAAGASQGTAEESHEGTATPENATPSHDASDRTQEQLDRASQVSEPIQLNPQRIHEVSAEISRRYNESPIGLDRLREVLGQVPKEDHPVAVQVLEQSSANMNRGLVDHQLEHLQSQIRKFEQAEGRKVDRITVLALDDTSVGKALGYLLRTNSDLPVDVRVLDRSTLKEGLRIEGPTVLLDDLGRATGEQKAFLKQQHGLYASDLGGFETGVNMFDLSLANMPQQRASLEELQSKIASTVDRVKAVDRQEIMNDLKARNPELTPKQLRKQADEIAVRQILKQNLDHAAGEYNLKIIRSDVETPGKGERLRKDDAQSYLQLLHAKVLSKPIFLSTAKKFEEITPHNVQSFLGKYHPSDNVTLTPIEQLAAGVMLRDGLLNNNYSAMLDRMQRLQPKLEAALPPGKTMSDVIVLTQVENNSSANLVHHLYTRLHKLGPHQLVSAADFVANPEAFKGKVVVYFDDYSFTGQQAVNHLDAPLKTAPRAEGAILSAAFEKAETPVIIAHLGGYLTEPQLLAKFGANPGNTFRPNRLVYAEDQVFTPFLGSPELQKLGLPNQQLSRISGKAAWQDRQFGVDVAAINPYRSHPTNNPTLVNSFIGTVLKQRTHNEYRCIEKAPKAQRLTITPGLSRGPAPGSAAELRALLNTTNADVVIDLRTGSGADRLEADMVERERRMLEDVSQGRPQPIEFHNLPVPIDYSSLSDPATYDHFLSQVHEFESILSRAHSEGKRAYFHCSKGYDRTGLMNALHDVLSRGKTIEESMEVWKRQAESNQNTEEFHKLYNRQMFEKILQDYRSRYAGS